MPVSRVVTITAVVLLTLVAGASVALAQAEASLGSKVRSGESVVVPPDETVPHDLYVTGGIVRVEGRVDGDVVASGGQIQVAGEVTGDALLAGGVVTVSGSVAGDVRAAGGEVAVDGEIGEDLLAAGRQVRLGQQTQIGEDFVFAAGEVTTAATVGGNVLGTAGRYDQRGTVAGQEQVEVPEPRRAPGPLDVVRAAIARYISLLLVAALLLWLAPRLLRRSADVLQREPLPALGIGAAGAVGGGIGVAIVLVLALLLAVLFGLLTLGGLAGLVVAVGLVTAAVLAVALVVGMGFVAHAVVALWLGRLAGTDDRSYGRALGAVAIGLVAVVVLTALPLVGGWIGLLIAVIGLGALLLALRRRRSETRPAPPSAAAPAA